MAKLVTLQNKFDGGMIRDVARDQLPRNASWKLRNFIPSEGSPLLKRGGWSYASPDMSTVKATASRLDLIIDCPFTAGSKLVAVDEDGELYTVASSSSATDIGALGSSAYDRGVFAFDKLILLGDYSFASVAPKTYDGATTIASLGGSPPNASLGCVYKNRLVLAGSSSNKNRIWFSAGNDITDWDTTNRYIDASDTAITAIAPLRNALLVFSRRSVERITGSIPPPGSDMVREPLTGPEIGGADTFRSVAFWGENVLWANYNGFFLSDGAAIEDLTVAGGISRLWRDSGSANAPYVLGVYRNYAFIYNQSSVDGIAHDIFVCDLARRVWFIASNIIRTVSNVTPGLNGEMYWCPNSTPRIAEVSSIFEPSSAVKNDADGTAVTCEVQTPFYALGGGKKTWKNVYLTFDVRDSASDDPTLAASYITSPEATSYTSASTLSETSTIDRKRVRLGIHAHGLGLKMVQSNASSDTRLYSIEADVHQRESSRL